MMKGIWFGDNIHSHADLNLVLSEVNIPPAKAKTNYVDIPGGDGSVDLTEALGEVKYEDRECTFTFTVFPNEDFEEKKRVVSNMLSGQRFQIILDKDPNYFWDGRCFINEYASDKNLHKIVVGAVVAPYKLKDKMTTVTASAGTSVVVALRNGRKRVIPTITCAAEATIKFNGNTMQFNAGTHKNLNIELLYGYNEAIVTSTGTVTFSYREGEL